MVNEQIVRRGITNETLLEILNLTARHEFVPVPLREAAYSDQPLPIGSGQTISQPYIVALMSDLLELTGNDRVLEIGTGSGYQSAILAQLCQHVFSMEVVPELVESSAAILTRLGYSNVSVRHGNGHKGLPDLAPFDKIIITAAPQAVPDALVQQLKPEGIMVLPVGTGYQDLIVIRKDVNGDESRSSVIPVRFVPMVNPE